MHYENHKSAVEDIQQRIATIRVSLNFDSKIAEREALQESMNEADFWNDQEAAQKVISTFKLIKTQVDPLEDVISRLDDVNVGLELAREEKDEELLIEADEMEGPGHAHELMHKYTREILSSSRRTFRRALRFCTSRRTP